MSDFLEFRKVQCKDCYRCLRECPVKAIDVKEHQAKIIEERCILCGHCTHVCPQNAKIVHSELATVRQLLASGEKVVATVAPAYISSLEQQDFGALRIALAKLGFADAEETAVGAQAVVEAYNAVLQKGEMRNFITSACPAACNLIQKYFPKALPYLAPVDSPMVAHAKMIRKAHPGAKVVFIGPCIAKKREGAESHLIDAVLTFEELRSMLEEKGIDLSTISRLPIAEQPQAANRAKAFPVTRGIIRSFYSLPEGYTYLAVDGIDRCMSALEKIEQLDHVFLEINVCPDGCINGPCSIDAGGMLKAEGDVLAYVERELATRPNTPPEPAGVNLAYMHPRLRNHSRPATEKEIEEVLHRTGKFRPEDELNCGSCGYSTCREKAWAVVNGYADIEMCLPYMRKRAESLAVEIVRNSPHGVLLVDGDMNIVDINATAMKMLGLGGSPDNFQKRAVSDFFPPFEFYSAYSEHRNTANHRLHIHSAGRYIDLNVVYLKEQNLLFGLMKDITDEVNYDRKLKEVKMETITTTDAVIMKQMRVAQEIASLLGETTAETKLALLNLKRMLADGDTDMQADGRPADWKTAKI